MKFWVGLFCPLLFVGGCVSRDSDTAVATGDGGRGGALKGTLQVDFRNDKHVINTDRGLVLIADAETGCDLISATIDWTSSWPNTLEEAWIDWRYDADMCEFATGKPVAIPLRERATVVFVGYNLGARDPSIFNCQFVSSTEEVQFFGYPWDGFDQNEPDRCRTVSDRCGGRCEIDTSGR